MWLLTKLVNEGGFKITAISENFTHLLSSVENQQPKESCELFHMKHLTHKITQDPSEIVDSSIVDSEQRMVNN